MNTEETSFFFEQLWEIWYNIANIDFLMRTAIALKDGEESIFPEPPYFKWQTFIKYPESFWHLTIETIVEKFNKRFPEVKIPKEYYELRHALAHWIIFQLENSNYQELIKFKKTNSTSGLEVEFWMLMEPEKLTIIRKSLVELRRLIIITMKNLKWGSP